MLLIHDKNLLLRPLKNEDYAALAKQANNAKIAASLRNYFPYPYSDWDAKQFIAGAITKKTITTFGIIYQNEFAGVISIVIQTDVYKNSAELGYWLGEPFWGQGIMTSAVNLICDYAFRELSLNRIYSKVFSNNEASMRVLKKCGFKEEGVAIKAIYKNGVYHDEHSFGLLVNN